MTLTSRQMSTFLMWTFFPVLALAFVVLPLLNVLDYARARAWVTAPAVIATVSGQPGATSCALSYTYEVNGQAYQGSKVSFVSSGVSVGRKPAGCILLEQHGYPGEGDAVQVKYDPAHPDRSVYLDVFPAMSVWSVLICAVFVGVVILAVRPPGRPAATTS